MKILKISLQNINSLKSEEEIVIDFENPLFKDVGLYAITGPTGAGKTTLLDAITIALYHQVPRFNHANSKGLEHVVSYGASEAFCSVVFENNNTIYEVYWGISLATANGKIRATPKEEVRLKNLTLEKIIAEKKRDVRLEVEKITSLNYDQFLRSILLAQGEFAAFLSAKGTEKAKLLEQITGEEIYKKIGETIQQKKATEKRKLEDLKLTIDDKNLLSEEELNQKKALYKEVDVALISLSEDKIIVEKIKEWYKKEKELSLDKTSIEKQEQDLEQFYALHKNDLAFLAKDILAQPFKELLVLIDKYLMDVNKYKLDLKNTQEELLKATNSEEHSRKAVEQKEQVLKIEEETYKKWSPKLEKAKVLDAEIKNLQVQLNKEQEEQEHLTKRQTILSTQTEIQQKEFTKLEREIVPLKKHIQENYLIPQLEKEFVEWNNVFTKIEGEQKGIIALKSQEKNLEDSLLKVAHQESVLSKNLKAISEKHSFQNKELETLNKTLKSQELTALLALKDKQEAELKKWQSFKEIAANFRIKKKSKDNLLLKIAVLNKALVFEKNNKELLEKKEKQAILVLKYEEKIFNQERLILSYEDERKKLIAGEDCVVCGSKEHPYVKEYNTKSLSKTEQKLIACKEEKDKISVALKTIDLTIATKTASLKELETQVVNIDKELKVFLASKNNLGVDVDFKEIQQIDQSLEACLKEVQHSTIGIKAVQEKIEERDLLLKKVSGILEELNVLKNEHSLCLSNQSKDKTRLQELKEELTKKQEGVNYLIKDLKASFTESGFKKEPEISIKDSLNLLKQHIITYNTEKQKLVAVEKQLSNLEIELKNSTENIKELNVTLKTKNNAVKDSLKNNEEKKTERNAILPIKHDVDTARVKLESLLEKAKKELIEATKIAEKNKEHLTTLKTQEKGNLKSLEETKTSLKGTKDKTEEKVKVSEFANIENVRNAILKDELREKYQQVERNYLSKTEALKTLKQKNTEAFKVLNKNKKHQTPEMEVDEKLNSFSEKTQKLSSTKGSLENEFEQNNKFIENNKKIVSEIKTQEKELSKWSRLLTILGGSKDAFNIYVQRLTLKSLIDLANIHLYKLNKRYSLQLESKYAKGEELSFKMLDHYQANQVRSVDTCSGGERFLISLALALGLSDLASNNVKIDSLFIDEGFGTLDGDTLETVVSTLENLQSQGKIIGVISHVESLKERISTQIQLQKKGQGISQVILVG